MSETPEGIISEAELVRVHGNANFGNQTKRGVVNEGLLKYAVGYTSGHTQMVILLEHGLITTPRPGSYAARPTKKGLRYLRAVLEQSKSWPELRRSLCEEAF